MNSVAPADKAAATCRESRAESPSLQAVVNTAATFGNLSGKFFVIEQRNAGFDYGGAHRSKPATEFSSRSEFRQNIIGGGSIVTGFVFEQLRHLIGPGLHYTI